MMAQNKKSNLGKNILIGLALGLFCGFLFGEECARLKIVGDLFIRLLQMTVLPYIMFSLIAGIGRLELTQAKMLARRVGVILLSFWGLAFSVILLMPLTFPGWKTASFFSASMVENKETMDYLSTYIPSNVFFALSSNLVPSVVVFSLFLGIAIISTPLEKKRPLIDLFHMISDALMRVSKAIVEYMPIGVFAIMANASGTMTLEQFDKLMVYFVPYIFSALVLTFVIIPLLITVFTPIRYREIFGATKDSFITAFASGSMFIILPLLSQNVKDLLKKHDLVDEQSENLIDIILPVVFCFPNLGKIIILLFVLFAGWYTGHPIGFAQYPAFILDGVISFFGSGNVAIPYLLDKFQIPADMFNLYMLTSVVNARFSTLLSAMSLFVIMILGTVFINGHKKFSPVKASRYLISGVIGVGVALLCSGAILSLTAKDSYTMDKIVVSMKLQSPAVEATIYRDVSDVTVFKGQSESSLMNIEDRGVIRIGYNPDNLPFSYFNEADELVGFDVDMAHSLARDLGVSIEFIPINRKNVFQLIDKEQLDIIMSGLVVTPWKLQVTQFAEPYLNLNLAFVVKDHRRHKFGTFSAIKNLKGVRIGVLDDNFFVERLREVIPDVEVVPIESIREFFENKDLELDALFTSAEVGSAWSLLFPEYQVVVPQPSHIKLPIAYAIPGKDPVMIQYMNQWLNLKEKYGFIEKLHDYWILGKNVQPKSPRWCLARDVFGWLK